MVHSQSTHFVSGVVCKIFYNGPPFTDGHQLSIFLGTVQLSSECVSATKCAAIGAILSRGALQMYFVRWLVSLLFSGGGLSLKKCILNQIALDQ